MKYKHTFMGQVPAPPHLIPPRRIPRRTSASFLILTTMLMKTRSAAPPGLYVEVDEHGLADTLDFGDDAFQVERFREHDLEDLLHVD